MNIILYNFPPGSPRTDMHGYLWTLAIKVCYLCTFCEIVDSLSNKPKVKKRYIHIYVNEHAGLLSFSSFLDRLADITSNS